MADASTTTAAVAEPAPETPTQTPATETKSVKEEGTLLGNNETPDTGAKTLLGEGAKPEGEAAEKGEGEASKDEEPKPSAPEAYEDFELPEGAQLDSELMDEFKPLAKELNLTQEQAQKLVSLQAKAAATAQARQEEAHQEQVTAWRDEIKSLPESDKVLASARKAVDVFAKDPEVRHFLTETWLGNHPLVVKFLAQVGKFAAEDSFTGGATASPRTPDARDIFTSMKNP